MDRINLYQFYTIGWQLRKLVAHPGDVPPTALIWEFISARATVSQLLEGKPVPLVVSRKACEDLSAALEELGSAHFESVSESGERKFKFPTEEDAPISKWRIDYIRSVLTTFETIFSAEMQEATSYFVPKRGIYVTSALIDAADQSFPHLLLSVIPEKARTEWRAAGRCLAFSLLSASGFHVARAVEAVLDIYIKEFSPSVDTTKFSWGDFLRELEDAKGSDPNHCPSDKVVSELRQLKDDFRNPLMHPRVVLSEADARVLFDNGESLIILMAEHLRSRKESSAARLLLG